ncbi:putative glutamyl endopeptidase [Citrus sinensis]|uniref:Glutamyl endopeptidase n=1 Tax=Citrus sinensis TaxID=2711 RepID=A0ACB8K841_CITSI|nr:putative glutamyl endopeptidase [Citrus sinensis]
MTHGATVSYPPWLYWLPNAISNQKQEVAQLEDFCFEALTTMETASAENAQGGGRYQLPPAELREIVDAPSLPVLSFSQRRDKILFLKRSALPPLVELARPEDKLAGIRIDGRCNTKSRIPFYTGLGIHLILPDDSLGPEKAVHGLPDGAKINFVTWSPDGKHLALSVRLDHDDDGEDGKLRIWVADVETGKAKPLFESPDMCLNAVFGSFVWVNSSVLLVYTIPLSRGDSPKKSLVPFGPKIQSNEQQNVIQNRYTEGLLKDEFDEYLFEHYTTTQLVLATLDGTVKEFGPPAIYTAVEPSPDQKYILITSIDRPYSFTVSYTKFPQKVQVWTADGKFVRQLCELPLVENIPIAYNSVREGMRLISWRADRPSTLYWVETQDGGAAKVEVSPRDIIYTQPAEPVEDTAPRILFDRSSEDVYSDPGLPMMRKSSTGTSVFSKIKKENDQGTYILLNGRGATPEGDIPFLALFNINTGSKERIRESDKEKYYETAVALNLDQSVGDVNLNQLKILTSKESKTEITQYWIQSWPHKKCRQITDFPHPYPLLSTLQKELIKYQRKDGVQLTAKLYLPTGYDPSKDGPLPCLFWAYPGEFRSKDAAGQVRGSPNEFSGMTPTSSLIFLARRFAVLAGPSVPIIGEGDEEPNDRFVEQLVSSAEAAVEEVVRRGVMKLTFSGAALVVQVAHPSKIAVGGLSYGGLMTANLLAHAPLSLLLWNCSFWKLQDDTYTFWFPEMSPFMSANKIEKPILLINGECDDKLGLFPLQSERLFDALKGHGVSCRLVILPFENHAYAARESIMHVIWETDRWLQKYCVSDT